MAKAKDRRALGAPLLMTEGPNGIDLDAVAALLRQELGDVLNPRKLKPVELQRLLNSTALGEVLNDRRLNKQRGRAGMRIGDDKTIDLFRYVAWLANERHQRRAKEAVGYAAHKEQARKRQEELSRAGRDIGELPAVVNPDRRERCRYSLKAFCEEYFPRVFYLKWSEDHLIVIAKMEQVILRGGLFALAMMRGGGKTAICEIACIWAALYGHQLYAAIIGPDEGHATSRIENIKTEFEHNDLLLEDFPEVCYPIRRLEGIYQRRLLYRGELIRMEFTAKRIILPNVTNSDTAGCIIQAAGITGQVRGMNYKRTDGQVVRPSLAILDDPQTDESARSLSQCAERERIINGAVLGLAGPGKSISAIMPCTVICPDDMADRLLDRKRNPHWQGERMKMLKSLPTNETLWNKYAELREAGLQEGRGLADATAFYVANRAAMDDGAGASWPERFNADEVSAIQHAMNLKLRNERAFFAEYQNEPLPEETNAEEMLSADEIARKLNNHKRGGIPLGCTSMTMFVDVQAKALYWVVAAWEPDFTGYVVDYGTYPDQLQAHFKNSEIRRTLSQAAPRAGLEGAIYAGLKKLTGDMLDREYKREDGVTMYIDRCLIDANWGRSTETVYQFCRQSENANIILPSHGKGVTASSTPFSEYKKKKGDKVGLNWRMPVVTGKRATRYVLYDTNYWKSFVHTRFGVAMGDAGCLSLYGRKAEGHRMFAEHCTAEFRVLTAGRNRVVEEWKLRPNEPDNHWWDGIVGCAVAASIEGVALPDVVQGNRKKQKVDFSELQRLARAGR